MDLYFFGGSFDPPHLAHKNIMVYFADRCDKLLIVPSFASPHKKQVPVASFLHRKNMLELMLSDYSKENFSIIDYECKNKLIYTCDTLKYILNEYSNFQIHLIIGADQYNKIHLWKDYKYILNNVNLVVVSRLGATINNKKYIYKYVDEISFDISSNDIKHRIINSNLDMNSIDINVFNYIKTNKLYK